MKNTLPFIPFFPADTFPTEIVPEMQGLIEQALRVVEAGREGEEALARLKQARGNVGPKNYFERQPGEGDWNPAKYKAGAYKQEEHCSDYFCAALWAQKAEAQLDSSVSELRSQITGAREHLGKYFSEEETYMARHHEFAEMQFHPFTHLVRPQAECNVTTAEEIVLSASELSSKLRAEFEGVLTIQRGRQALSRRYRLSRSQFEVWEASEELVERLRRTLEDAVAEPETITHNKRWCKRLVGRDLNYVQAVERCLLQRKAGVVLVVVDQGFRKIYQDLVRYSGDLRPQFGDRDGGSVFGGGFPSEPQD